MEAKHAADVKARRGSVAVPHPHKNLGRFLHPKKSR
jgi:hypothetical protein